MAAYRFGHSMTRPRYTVQDYVTRPAPPWPSERAAVPGAAQRQQLERVSPVAASVRLQWSKFFNVPGDPKTARPVRQFDATMATPLFTLPTTALPDSNPLESSSSRNLLRGKKMGLPSGQQVARLMGVTPLTNAQLWKSHRIEVRSPSRT